MKKTVFLLICLCVLFFCCSLSSRAWGSSLEESIAEEAGEVLVDSPYISAEERNGDKHINIFEKAYTVTLDALKSGGSELLKSGGQLLGLLLLCSLLGVSKTLTASPALAVAGETLSVLVLSASVYGVLYRCFVFVTCSMEALSLTVSSLLPVMSGLYAMGGNTAVAASSSSLLMVFLTVVSFLCSKAILPLLKLSFGFSLTGALPGNANLAPLGTALKSVCTVTLSFLFSVLSFALWYQTAVAAAGDTLVTRSVRFAAGAFVPVIGGILGEVSRTVLASVGVVRSAVGAVGTTLVLAAIIPPVLSVLLHRLLLTVLSSVSRILGCERESRFLCDASACMGVLLALVLGAGAVTLVALAVFVKTGTGA